LANSNTKKKLPILLLSKAEVMELTSTAIDMSNDTTTRKEMENYLPMNKLFQRLGQLQHDRAIVFKAWYTKRKKPLSLEEVFEEK
jgi:hypothetical protein